MIKVIIRSGRRNTVDGVPQDDWWLCQTDRCVLEKKPEREASFSGMCVNTFNFRHHWSSQVLSPQWDWEAWKSCSCSGGLWFCSAAMARKVSLWICLALLYNKTPMKTRTVPAALRMVIWLLNTMTLSHTDRACLTVLATLRKSKSC